MRHILVLEDDVELLHCFQQLLEAAGYRVTAISDPRKAMELLSPIPVYPPDRFDFIWSAGLRWKSCYVLAAHQYGLRNLVVVTGSKEVIQHVDSLEVKHFEKPLNPVEIVDYIRRCCPPN